MGIELVKRLSIYPGRLTMIKANSIDTTSNEKKEYKKIAHRLLESYISSSVDFFIEKLIKFPQLEKRTFTEETHLYSVHFEEIEIRSNKETSIFIGFAIDFNMEKFILGTWKREANEDTYNFWLRVCSQLKESNINSIEINNFDEHFWLNEAMNKTFYASTQVLD